MESLLRGLENADELRFGLLPGVTVKRPETDELHRMGVKSGGVIPKQPPGIFIGHTGVGFGDIEAVRRAVEEEAKKPDNVNKLTRATAHERHLFVWVDPLESPAAASTGFMDIALPQGCDLPPEVDVVWIASPTVDDARH